MLIVIGRVGCEAGKREQLVEALSWMQAESRGEPGCLNYGFHSSVEDPDQFIAVEEWESVDALRTHFAAPSVAGFGARIGGLVAGRPEVRIHLVERTSEFPDLSLFEQ